MTGAEAAAIEGPLLGASGARALASSAAASTARRSRHRAANMAACRRLWRIRNTKPTGIITTVTAIATPAMTIASPMACPMVCRSLTAITAVAMAATPPTDRTPPPVVVQVP